MLSADQRRARAVKIARLREGNAPRLLELCSGCGGLALGLKSAGFALTAHVESDTAAAQTYALNLTPPELLSKKWALPRDMVKSSAADLVRDLELGVATSAAFDVLAAGLPCQAFARIGRSKLREIAGGEEDAFRKDPRATLYRRFLNYVIDTQPLAIVIENVPDILNFGGHNVPEEISETLEKIGYRSTYTILNAGNYGVPQIRDRLFLIAFANSLGVQPAFPAPTHFLDLPSGYEGSRSNALKHVSHDSPHFSPIRQPSRRLKKATSARDALGDLPRIKEHLSDPKSMLLRRIDEKLSYRKTAEPSEYARLLRAWEGFEIESELDGHRIRVTPRDFAIFASMPHGADYPQARKIAEAMFAKALRRRRFSNGSARLAESRKLRKAIVPPYDPEKFPNKWWKLDPSKPSRTLTAHMGRDTYSHIHYDSRQCRTVSVREAARLQSFPDGFRFQCCMNAAFRQIGNAVPPLLALAVATTLRDQLDEVIATQSVSLGKRAA
jgi:DNA (cytosine-5)-methyltransferase 1